MASASAPALDAGIAFPDDGSCKPNTPFLLLVAFGYGAHHNDRNQTRIMKLSKMFLIMPISYRGIDLKEKGSLFSKE